MSATGTTVMHYCTYCHHYARDHVTGELVYAMPVFVGSYAEVVKHADRHPIGYPADMAQPVDSPDLGLWLPARNEHDRSRPFFAYRENVAGENQFRLDKNGKHIRYASPEGAQLAAVVLNLKGEWS
ncbi:hypothetical protein SEA_REYNAULD_95 [Rhodococcus phage Reynauld]|uniref:Uncharacterized protein n=1 Tax=Rhodococcus phage Reynauld TaxID=3062845 RepID=A0ACD4UJN2_9CAUD|nr:hypothetical protein SEA_REYNAULD_95 [Rhodococcus phage Reynauld]